MTAVAELTAPNLLKLPPEVAALFRLEDRFVVWAEGDTVHLKRITPGLVLDIMEQAPDEEPMPMEEINAIVHEVRRQHRAE